jgi:hypothetical protein
VGVIVGVRVVVGLILGLGDIVTVGGWVPDGRIVFVAALLGIGVQLDVGLDVAGCWHEDNKHTSKKNIPENFRRDLSGNREKGVMIADFPIRYTKGVITISDESLGGCSCPGKVTRVSLAGITSKFKLTIG